MTALRYVLLEDRGVLALAGADARSFLQGMISNDVRKVDAARTIYAALLTPQGKYLHDFIVAELGDGLVLDCERARRDDLARRLALYRLRANVQIADRSEALGVAAVIGEGAASVFGLEARAGAAAPFGGGVVFVDPRLAELGLRTILPRDGAAGALERAGLAPAPAETYDRHRLALGVPDAGRDLVVGRSFLLESNFEELNGVDFAKGCYVGQENTARQKYRATVRRRLMRVDADGLLPAAGTPILLGKREAGVLRSGADGMAIALLRLDCVEEAAATGAPLSAGGVRVRPVEPRSARP